MPAAPEGEEGVPVRGTPGAVGTGQEPFGTEGVGLLPDRRVAVDQGRRDEHQVDSLP